MFRRDLRPLIWAHICLSAGGLLLHMRVHPLEASALNWLPLLVGLVNLFALPFMFNNARTVAWAYVINFATVVTGTLAMAWYTAASWEQPVTSGVAILKSTLPAIVLLGAKLPIAHGILCCHRALAEPRGDNPGEAPPDSGSDFLETTELPGAKNVDSPAPYSDGARLLLGLFITLVFAALLGAATWIGTLSHAQYSDYAGPVQGAMRTAGKIAGLWAAMLLMTQFAMSARLRFLDRIFAHDRLLRMHAVTGAAAGVLATAHPALLYATQGLDLGKLRLELWPEMLGALVLLAVYTIAVTTIWRKFLALSYENWHQIHYLAFCVVAIITIHLLSIGGDLREGWPRVFWLAAVGAYALLFVWSKFIRSRVIGRDYTITDVSAVNYNTWQLTMGPAGPKRVRHLPGQFAFITVHGEGLPAQEHPFTISSCPRADGALSFTIKQSGDFTSQIGRACAGDRVVVDGPYGHFSHRLHDGEDLIFIAGGVGITPMLSMLRYIAATGDTRRITLIWANRTEADIFLRREIRELAARLRGMTVHNVLSNQDDYDGLQGYVDGALLRSLLGAEKRSAHVFVCGPPPMMDTVARELRKLGYAKGSVHTERFSL